jgi:hypothetical protein
MIAKINNQELLEQITKKLKSKNWKEQQFNIFNACSIEKRELAHSSFITNLLDPYGTHSYGNSFLKVFLETLKTKYPEIEIDKLTDNVNVETEKTLPNGIVDIWIKNKSENAYLLIENKIYAGDERKQLLRYREFLNGQSKAHKEQRKGILLYLTVNGKRASDFSTDGKVERNQPNGYYTISYYDTIRKWLSSCLTTDLPIRVKLAVEQYIELIDFLNFEADLRDELLPKIDKETVDKALSKSNEKQIQSFLEYLRYSCDRQQNKL